VILKGRRDRRKRDMAMPTARVLHGFCASHPLRGHSARSRKQESCTFLAVNEILHLRSLALPADRGYPTRYDGSPQPDRPGGRGFRDAGFARHEDPCQFFKEMASQ
jgi:hypothetical protein